jgi:hypothetical protein
MAVLIGFGALKLLRDVIKALRGNTALKITDDD